MDYCNATSVSDWFPPKTTENLEDPTSGVTQFCFGKLRSEPMRHVDNSYFNVVKFIIEFLKISEEMNIGR